MAMDLQNFVTEVIEAAGGIVIPLEYALCHAMVPEEHSRLFNGRNEALLAFDSEVFHENPDAEFVTFGSYVLDKVIELALTGACATVRFAVADRHEPSDPVGKMRQGLSLAGKADARTEIAIMHERPVLCLWPVFNIRVAYVSDERFEEIMTVWVDPVAGKVSEKMAEMQSGIFYEKRPVYPYPVASIPDIPGAFREAASYAKSRAGRQSVRYMRRDELERELARIEEYYRSLEAENVKRMSRKGVTEEHRQELQDKGRALVAEKEKQIAEMKGRYTVRTELSLDNGVIYAVPGMEYRVAATSRAGTEERTAYYNPVTREFSWSML